METSLTSQRGTTNEYLCQNKSLLFSPLAANNSLGIHQFPHSDTRTNMNTNSCSCLDASYYAGSEFETPIFTPPKAFRDMNCMLIPHGCDLTSSREEDAKSLGIISLTADKECLDYHYESDNVSLSSDVSTDSIGNEPNISEASTPTTTPSKEAFFHFLSQDTNITLDDKEQNCGLKQDNDNISTFTSSFTLNSFQEAADGNKTMVLLHMKNDEPDLNQTYDVESKPAWMTKKPPTGLNRKKKNRNIVNTENGANDLKAEALEHSLQPSAGGKIEEPNIASLDLDGNNNVVKKEGQLHKTPSCTSVYDNQHFEDETNVSDSCHTASFTFVTDLSSTADHLSPVMLTASSSDDPMLTKLSNGTPTLSVTTNLIDTGAFDKQYEKPEQNTSYLIPRDRVVVGCDGSREGDNSFFQESSFLKSASTFVSFPATPEVSLCPTMNDRTASSRTRVGMDYLSSTPRAVRQPTVGGERRTPLTSSKEIRLRTKLLTNSVIKENVPACGTKSNVATGKIEENARPPPVKRKKTSFIKALKRQFLCNNATNASVLSQPDQTFTATTCLGRVFKTEAINRTAQQLNETTQIQIKPSHPSSYRETSKSGVKKKKLPSRRFPLCREKCDASAFVSFVSLDRSFSSLPVWCHQFISTTNLKHKGVTVSPTVEDSAYLPKPKSIGISTSTSDTTCDQSTPKGSQMEKTTEKTFTVVQERNDSPTQSLSKSVGISTSLSEPKVISPNQPGLSQTPVTGSTVPWQSGIARNTTTKQYTHDNTIIQKKEMTDYQDRPLAQLIKKSATTRPDSQNHRSLDPLIKDNSTTNSDFPANRPLTPIIKNTSTTKPTTRADKVTVSKSTGCSIPARPLPVPVTHPASQGEPTGKNGRQIAAWLDKFNANSTVVKAKLRLDSEEARRMLLDLCRKFRVRVQVAATDPSVLLLEKISYGRTPSVRDCQRMKRERV